MRVLLVGATGVVGRQLVPQLLAAGHEVVATTTRTPGSAGFAPDARLAVVTLDVLDPDAVRTLVRHHRPHAIVHQATALRGLGNDLRRFDQYFETTNRLRTNGTRALLAAARDAGGIRLVAQSFGGGWTHARVGGPVKTEADPLEPDPLPSFRRTYAAIRELESLVGGYDEGVVLRYGGLYGPGTSLAPGGAQVEAVRRRRLPLVGDGGGVWSFLHVTDAASAAVAALSRGHGTYNVVDDDPAPVREWLPHLAAVLGAPPPRRVPAWLARIVAGEGAVRLMTEVRGSSNAKAKRELDWAPSVPSWRDGFRTELTGTPSAARTAPPA